MLSNSMCVCERSFFRIEKGCVINIWKKCTQQIFRMGKTSTAEKTFSNEKQYVNCAVSKKTVFFPSEWVKYVLYAATMKWTTMKGKNDYEKSIYQTGSAHAYPSSSLPAREMPKKWSCVPYDLNASRYVTIQHKINCTIFHLQIVSVDDTRSSFTTHSQWMF